MPVRYLIVAASAVCLFASAPGARAQSASGNSTGAGSSQSGGLDEIVVTAQRREEGIQETPISVTAFSGQTLANFDVKDFSDFAKLVPNLAFGMGGSPYNGPAYGVSSTREIVIRGVSGANTTSLYIDDTPIPNVIDPRVLDLERVEVLRGPQGTLFGASSMGGTVRYITKAPDLDTTDGRIDAQTYDINAGGAGFDLSGAVNTPVMSGNSALRVSAFYEYDPGYFNRIYGVPVVPGVAFQPGQQVMGSTKIGSSHEYGGTVSLLVKPESVEGLSITPMMMVQRTSVDGYQLATNDPSNFTQVVPLNAPENSLDEWQFYALTAKYSASFGDFVSSSSYLHRYSSDLEDGTTWLADFQSYYYTPLPYISQPAPISFDINQPTQELRFESRFNGPLQMVVGAFYQRTQLQELASAVAPGINALSGGYLGSDLVYGDQVANVNDQIAGFVDLTYKVTQGLEFSVGARKARLRSSQSEQTEQFPVLDANTTDSFHEQDEPFTPRYVAKYSFDPGNMVYASASKGFRIGGGNGPLLNVCAADAAAVGLPVGVPIPYHSDSLWSYEVGSKNTFDDQRVATRVALYQIDWSNIQQTLVLPTCGLAVLTNAGAARIDGGEAEISTQVTRALQIDGAFGYEDGRITGATTLAGGGVLGFPVGSPLSNVPKWTASLRAQYTQPTSLGDAFIRSEYSFTGSSLSLANGGTGLYRDEYMLVDLRAGLKTGDYTATLFAKNLLNRAANFGDFVSNVGQIPGEHRLVVAQPRTIGLEIERRFGQAH